MPYGEKDDPAFQLDFQSTTCHTHAMSEGIVYVLTNEAMPGLVKIGYTTQAINDRLSNLYSTGVPLPFECAFACHTENIEELEKALHAAFAPNRINPKREFFQIEASQVIPLLKYCNHAQQEVTEEVQKELDKDVSEQEEAAERKFRKKRAKFDFQEMGIPVGEAIQFDAGDTPVIAIVHDTRRVKYNGNIYYLTPLTRELRNADYNVDPLPYWTYQGQSLKDIYNEVYPFNFPPEDI